MNRYYALIFIVVVLVLDLDVVAASWLGFCRFSSLKRLEVSWSRSTRHQISNPPISYVIVVPSTWNIAWQRSIIWRETMVWIWILMHHSSPALSPTTTSMNRHIRTPTFQTEQHISTSLLSILQKHYGHWSYKRAISVVGYLHPRPVVGLPSSAATRHNIRRWRRTILWPYRFQYKDWRRREIKFRSDT